jgi:glycoprotein endo-alpha-1,2-mannosidase
MSNRSRLTAPPGAPAAIAEFSLSACLFFFLIQALRDILISPGGFEYVAVIVYVFAAAPVIAGLLNLLPLGMPLAVLGAVAAIAGRFLMLQPDLPRYYLGECLALSGFWFYFVSRLSSHARRPEHEARAGVCMLAAGLLTAPILHLALRASDRVEHNAVIFAMIALAAVSLAILVLAGKSSSADSAAQSTQPRPSLASGFSIFLIAIPIHYIYQYALRPETFSGATDISYGATATVVKIALLLAVVATVRAAGRRATLLTYAGTCVLATFAMLIFGLLFSLPRGAFSLALIGIALFGVSTSLGPLLAFFTLRRVPARGLFLGLGATASAFSMLAFSIYLIEHHEPIVNWLTAGFLALGLAVIVITQRKKTLEFTGDSPAGFSRTAMAAVALVALCVAFFPANTPRHNLRDAGRKVIACLYTWYGVPGKPYGMFGFETIRKPAVKGVWQIDDSGIGNSNVSIRTYPVPTPVTRDEMRKEKIWALDSGNQLFAFRPRQFVVVSGDSDSARHGRIVLSATANTSLLPLTSRIYFQFNGRFEGTKPDVAFFIRRDGVVYGTRLRTPSMPQASFELVFPKDFTSATGKGPDAMGFEVACPKAGPCAFGLSDVEVSEWRHWDEDYHTAQVDGKWRNDPPDTLAAAHHAFYSGRPWPDIASYSPDGYYDSWDPAVMRSQLQLMEKAGIDAVLIMHPHTASVVQVVLDMLDAMHSPLQVAYYNKYDLDKPEMSIDIINRFGSHPRWMKVGGRPVWFVGMTGLEAKPYKVYEQEFAKLRRRTRAFLVGDQYAPPKEEMLALLDGHYYYDTSGEHRARWGAPDIQVAQPDGHYVTGHGHLDTLFRSISNLVHFRNQLYVATVIPGTDNTRVHDFTGSPFYDGRPGTIVKRRHGRTYAETWRAAIRSRADWVCIVSWNELHEGTEIEPTKEDGTFYVEQTRIWADAFRRGREPRQNSSASQ